MGAKSQQPTWVRRPQYSHKDIFSVSLPCLVLLLDSSITSNSFMSSVWLAYSKVSCVRSLEVPVAPTSRAGASDIINCALYRLQT